MRWWLRSKRKLWCNSCRLQGEKGCSLIPSERKADTNEYTVIWLDEGVELQDALSRASRHDTSRGVVANKQGLGIRVPREKFMEMVTKFVSPTTAAKEIRRQGQKVYEVSKAPPWVDVEELISTLRTQWNWDVDYLRTIKGWNTKTILVKSTSEPKRDTIIVGLHRMTVQPAKERSTTRPVISAGKVSQNNAGTRPTPARMPASSTPIQVQKVVAPDHSATLNLILERLTALEEKQVRKKKLIKKKTDPGEITDAGRTS